MTDPVAQQLSAYNDGDIDAFMATYHDDIRIEDGMGKTIVAGKPEMRRQYSALFAQSPDLLAEVEIHWESHEWIINEEKITGMVGEGAPSELHAMVAYHIRDGLIDFVRMFM